MCKFLKYVLWSPSVPERPCFFVRLYQITEWFPSLQQSLVVSSYLRRGIHNILFMKIRLQEKKILGYIKHNMAVWFFKASKTL